MIFGVVATSCQSPGMAAWATNRAIMRRDTIIRKNSTSCALLMRLARFMWFAPFLELGRLLHFLPPKKTLVQKEYSFLGINVVDLHIL